MYTPTLLVKKRQGLALTDEEIRFLVDGFCSGVVEDYQMSAFAMAVCLRGMDARETATLTRCMLESGDRLPRPANSGSQDRPRVDKHSTGGLGDKVSLILAPLLASCDLDVPMISGRGLGLSGGTLDKLESIPGFRTDLSIEESSQQLRAVGAFIMGATERIAPADRKLYALRDVTGTVESISLITASILSKKLAANLDALVMDVKAGSGAFMKTLEEATELSESLVRVGEQSGLPTSVIVTDMDQPLGEFIGNACEVQESLEVLRGQGGSGDGGSGHSEGGQGDVVRDLTIELCASLLVQVGHVESLEQARRRLVDRLDSGHAMERFERMVHAQSGSLDAGLVIAEAHDVLADREGFLARFDCDALGEAVVSLGGGRRKKGDAIDHSVGIRVHGRVGAPVQKGDPILTLYCPTHLAANYVKTLQAAVVIQDSNICPRPLIMKQLGPSK